MRSILLSVGLVCALAAPAFADLGATGKISLLSISGPTYNYQVDVTNTGDTTIGTFWYGWVPGVDYLPSLPTVTSTPAGWFGNVEATSGYSIEWYRNSGNYIQPGQTFTFKFSSHDSPAVLGSGYTQTSYVYIGSPLGDQGYSFTLPAVVVPEPASLAVLGMGGVLLMRRRRPA